MPELFRHGIHILNIFQTFVLIECNNQAKTSEISGAAHKGGDKTMASPR
jgi:hypothetical protein